ncbi:YibE/F family protein [Kribbella deserti]|uniref:YibE/F family protein n=1 Tax=Kribbella deserti TaxID=1926257 RepID=A0ABV6QTJ4_9ACTN
MLVAISGMPQLYALSTERVAVEVVRALVGSLGIIAAMPLTTALAALATPAKTSCHLY